MRKIVYATVTAVLTFFATAAQAAEPRVIEALWTVEWDVGQLYHFSDAVTCRDHQQLDDLAAVFKDGTQAVQLRLQTLEESDASSPALCGQDSFLAVVMKKEEPQILSKNGLFFELIIYEINRGHGEKNRFIGKVVPVKEVQKG
jgi:hypothetical protein